MDKLKQWVALTVVAVLAVLAAGWFLVVSPKRSEAAELTVRTTQQEADNQTLGVQLAMLRSQAEKLPQQRRKLADVTAKVPGSSALPALLRALDDTAHDSGLELVTVSPGTAVDYVSPDAAAAAATTGARLPAATAGGGTPGSLQVVPVTVKVAGSYFPVERFLDALENLERAFKVTGVTVAPGANPVKPAVAGANDTETGRSLLATVVGQVFVSRTAAGSAVPAPTASVPATPVR